MLNTSDGHYTFDSGAERPLEGTIVIGKHVFSEEENAMLLEDRQAVIEGVKSNAK